MADMHQHPAMGMVIARLEHREWDIEELMGIHDADDTHSINIAQLEAAARDLVDFAAFLALEAFSEGHPDRTDHEAVPEHVEHTLGILRDIALYMPLIEGGGPSGGDPGSR